MTDKSDPGDLWSGDVGAFQLYDPATAHIMTDQEAKNNVLIAAHIGNPDKRARAMAAIIARDKPGLRAIMAEPE